MIGLAHCFTPAGAYRHAMDWQQIAALAVVAVTALLFVVTRFLPRRPKWARHTHCGCSGAANGGGAQAVAARSYTLFYKGRRGAEGFDLFSTVEDQVYGPVGIERPEDGTLDVWHRPRVLGAGGARRAGGACSPKIARALAGGA